jgi:hypothetical protein
LLTAISSTSRIVRTVGSVGVAVCCLTAVGGGTAGAADVNDLSVRPSGTACFATIAVAGTSSVNVTLHSVGGPDQTIGAVFPGVPVGVPVIGCSATGSSSTTLVWVTGSDTDPDLGNNVALI